jgi:hypothetical protein
MPREEIISGDDENIVGALTSALMQRARGTAFRATPGGTVSAPRFSMAQLANQVGGTQENKLRAPLGLGSNVFSDNSPFSFIVEPQEAFRGERLIVDVALSAGAELLLSIDEILVGSLPQTPSTEFGLPAVMFRADATDAAMDWQICPAGTKIIIKAHAVGTFGEADTLTAQLGLYGVWIRG